MSFGYIVYFNKSIDVSIKLPPIISTKTALQMLVNTTFNFYSDSNGKDPDSASPTLRKYHKILWSKLLPNGKYFELSDNKNGYYLYHCSELGEHILGSDAITHSYKNQKRKLWLTQQVLNDVNELFDLGSTIGAFIIFPNNRIEGKPTINGARGFNSLIDDRFDLTLECIRLFYLGKASPLYETFLRYKNFFDLFESFDGYIDFFLLDDLIDENHQIKFYLPFDNFQKRPTFYSASDYLIYKDGVINFIKSRNQRILTYAKKHMIEKDANH